MQTTRKIWLTLTVALVCLPDPCLAQPAGREPRIRRDQEQEQKPKQEQEPEQEQDQGQEPAPAVAEGLAWGPGPVARPIAKIQAIEHAAWHSVGATFTIQGAGGEGSSQKPKVKLTPPEDRGAADGDVDFDDELASGATRARITLSLSPAQEKARSAGKPFEGSGAVKVGGSRAEFTNKWHLAVQAALQEAVLAAAKAKRGDGKLDGAKGTVWVDAILSDEDTSGEYRVKVRAIVVVK